MLLFVVGKMKVFMFSLEMKEFFLNLGIICNFLYVEKYKGFTSEVKFFFLCLAA